MPCVKKSFEIALHYCRLWRPQRRPKLLLLLSFFCCKPATRARDIDVLLYTVFLFVSFTAKIYSVLNSICFRIIQLGGVLQPFSFGGTKYTLADLTRNKKKTNSFTLLYYPYLREPRVLMALLRKL